MAEYTYTKALDNSHKVNWKIDEVIGGRTFDTSRRWLPSLLSTAHDGIDNVGRNSSIRRKIISKGSLKPLPRPVAMGHTGHG